MKKVLVMFLMSTLGLTQTMADNQVKDVVIAQATETRASAFSGGEGTEENPYLISTAEDLVQLSADVNAAQVHQGHFFKMTNDIDMSSVERFLPIGNNHGKGADVKCFMGIFDGQDYTVKNLNCNYEGMGLNYQGVGMFGLTMQATVKNVRIEDSKFIGYGMVGAIVSAPIGSTIQNCHVGQNVIVTAEKLGAGGVCGVALLMPSTIEDCSSAATVFAGDAGGGAAGIIAGVSQDAGGTKIKRCVNFGEVTSDNDFAAGVLAMIEQPAVIEDCVNFGDINTLKGATGIAYFAVTTGKHSLLIDNCYNVGEMIGGDPDYMDAISLGNVYVGGDPEHSVITNCFFAEDVNEAKSNVAIGMQSADMLTQDFVDKLNNGREDGPWCIVEGVAFGFPVPFAGIIPTSIDNVEASAAAINYNAGVVTVSGAKVGEKFAVVDMAGRTVKMAEAQNGVLTIDMNNLPAGVYAISNGTISKKIVK